MTAKLGDLVRTPEGYYGIVTDMAERLVFQGNGMEKYLDDHEWERLAVMPMNIFDNGGPSNFIELINSRDSLRRVIEAGGLTVE